MFQFFFFHSTIKNLLIEFNLGMFSKFIGQISALIFLWGSNIKYECNFKFVQEQMIIWCDFSSTLYPQEQTFCIFASLECPNLCEQYLVIYFFLYRKFGFVTHSQHWVIYKELYTNNFVENSIFFETKKLNSRVSV